MYDEFILLFTIFSSINLELQVQKLELPLLMPQYLEDRNQLFHKHHQLAILTHHIKDPQILIKGHQIQLMADHQCLMIRTLMSEQMVFHYLVL